MSTGLAEPLPARTRWKDSGIPWIDAVPPHWDVILLRLVARIESGHTLSRQHPEYWIPDECVIPWFSLADVWQLRDGNQKFLGETTERISELGIRNSAARLLPAGTVVLSRTASVGFSGIMPRPMATTQDFVNWVCGPRIIPDYLMWVFRAMKSEFDRLMMGSTHQTIYMPDIGQFRGPLPTLDEQRAIAAFLDRETTRIDALIEKKHRQIELLHEKRAALISHAVTKGLDPTAPMKDSGIQWLGQIPEHWQACPLRRLIIGNPRNGVSPPPAADGEGVPSFSISAVRDGRVSIADNLKYCSLTPAEARQALVRRGDVLVVRGNGNLDLVGRCGSVDEDPPEGCIYPDILIRLRPRPEMCPAFLVAAINSAPVRAQIQSAARTANGTWKISGEDIRGFVVASPPRDEQAGIMERVSATAGQLDTIIAKVALGIDRLREYRTALISAAVTGKIEVRQGGA